MVYIFKVPPLHSGKNDIWCDIRINLPTKFETYFMTFLVLLRKKKHLFSSFQRLLGTSCSTFHKLNSSLLEKFFSMKWLISTQINNWNFYIHFTMYKPGNLFFPHSFIRVQLYVVHWRYRHWGNLKYLFITSPAQPNLLLVTPAPGLVLAEVPSDALCLCHPPGVPIGSLNKMSAHSVQPFGQL